MNPKPENLKTFVVMKLGGRFGVTYKAVSQDPFEYGSSPEFETPEQVDQWLKDNQGVKV